MNNPMPKQETTKEIEKIAQGIVDRFFGLGASVKKQDYDFVCSALHRTYEAAYQEGLNLRKEYNDPELLEKIKQAAREERDGEIIKEIKRVMEEMIGPTYPPWPPDIQGGLQALYELDKFILALHPKTQEEK